jgi:hypothetical protein
MVRESNQTSAGISDEGSKLALARQRKLQIMGYFTTKKLYNCSIQSSSKDYKLKNLYSLACLPFL